MWSIPKALPSPLIILSSIHGTRRCLPPQTKRHPKAATPRAASAHRAFSLHGYPTGYTPTLSIPSSLTRNTGASNTTNAAATVRPPMRGWHDSGRDDNRRGAWSRCARVHACARRRCRRHRHTLWRPCVQKRSGMRRSRGVHRFSGPWFAGFQPTILSQVALVHRADVSLEVVDAEETHPAAESNAVSRALVRSETEISRRLKTLL